MTGDDGVLFYADGDVFAPLATGEQQVFSRCLLYTSGIGYERGAAVQHGGKLVGDQST